MKKFIYSILAVASLASATVLYGQEGEPSGEDIVVTAGFGASIATVTPVSPGVAKVEINPVYMVSLDKAVEGVQSARTSPDISGKGTVYMSRMGRRAMLSGRKVCWKGVDFPAACGAIEGSITTATLNVGQLRNKMIVAVPVALDADGREVAYVAHPQNTQFMLGNDMKSGLWVNDEGTISIATRQQIGNYQRSTGA